MNNFGPIQNMSSTNIFHICKSSDFDPKAESYSADSLDTVGFIHCTKEAEMLIPVANLWLKDKSGDFIVLCIDESKLTSAVKYEAPSKPKEENEDSETIEKAQVLMPHVYGVINVDAVTNTFPCVRDQDGTFLSIDQSV